MKMKLFYRSIAPVVLLLVVHTTPVFAQTWNTSDGSEPATFKDLEVVFTNILGVLMALAGVAAFVMLVVGGYHYMFSQGDPGKVAAARGTMTWAVVGILFLIGAWFILQLIGEFTGVQVTTFTIPGV